MDFGALMVLFACDSNLELSYSDQDSKLTIKHVSDGYEVEYTSEAHHRIKRFVDLAQAAQAYTNTRSGLRIEFNGISLDQCFGDYE